VDRQSLQQCFLCGARTQFVRSGTL